MPPSALGRDIGSGLWGAFGGTILAGMPEDGTLYERFGSTFPAGAVIFREAEGGDRMYIIQKGKVRISKRIGDTEHTLAILEKGEFFGEMAIVTRSPRTATAVALDEVRALSFTRDGFLGMIAKNAKIALNIIDRLCQRLEGANAQIQRLLRRNARALVALDLYYGFQASGWAQAELDIEGTTREIASNLELPPDVVKEHLEGLRTAGALRIEGSIRLADRSRLESIAEVRPARGGEDSAAI
jgi:CRP/FNR family transcriptional regulator, cyclic AMP receptor protein